MDSQSNKMNDYTSSLIQAMHDHFKRYLEEMLAAQKAIEYKVQQIWCTSHHHSVRPKSYVEITIMMAIPICQLSSP